MRPIMKIRNDITARGQRAPTDEEVRAAYGPAKTNGWPSSSEQLAQDNALRAVGHYSLLSHAFETASALAMPQFLGYGALSGLTQNGLVRAGVSMVADEMTREWIEIKRSGEGTKSDERITALNEELKAFNVRDVFLEAKEQDGYYGGCLVYVDTGETSPEKLKTPLTLDPATFARGSLKGFKVIEPFNVAPGSYNSTEPWSSAYFKPKTWWVLGREMHASRFLHFAGNKVSTLLLPAYNFFGIPTSQIVLDALGHFTTCREAEARLLTKFSTTVLKTNMSALLSGGGEEELNKRIRYMVEKRDNDGVLAINNGDPNNDGEDMIKLETPLSGVTDIVRQSMEMVAAYFSEPVVKLWGISPAGFNATGDSDMANHYDHIASQQEKIFRAPLEKVLMLLQINRLGDIDKDITFSFVPLGGDDDKQKAEIRKLKAETDVALATAGAVSQAEIRARLASDVDSGYNNIDVDEVPDDPLDAGGEGAREDAAI
jgi:phage-related protein (TIGR01555 family)